MNERTLHVAVIGAGGNIGSHLTPLVARLPGVARLTLVDPGVYEAKDRAGQAVAVADVGRRKVDVLAERLAALDPALEVRTYAEPVEDVPRGRLRADVLLSGLDTRRARQTVNLVALRLGLTWIDAGVDGGEELARVSVLRPGADAPCLECGWDDGDYALLEQVYACGDDAEEYATAAPAALGALAAGWQALACRRVLAGETDGLAATGDVLLVPGAARALSSTLARRPQCRIGDHDRWAVAPCPKPPERLTLADVRRLGDGGDGRVALAVEGQDFVTRLACPECGFDEPIVVLARRLARETRPCPRCGTGFEPTGLDRTNSLDLDALDPVRARTRLSETGLAHGDILTCGRDGRVRHYELPRGARPGGECEEGGTAS